MSLQGPHETIGAAEPSDYPLLRSLLRAPPMYRVQEDKFTFVTSAISDVPKSGPRVDRGVKSKKRKGMMHEKEKDSGQVRCSPDTTVKSPPVPYHLPDQYQELGEAGAETAQTPEESNLLLDHLRDQQKRHRAAKVGMDNLTSLRWTAEQLPRPGELAKKETQSDQATYKVEGSDADYYAMQPAYHTAPKRSKLEEPVQQVHYAPSPNQYYLASDRTGGYLADLRTSGPAIPCYGVRGTFQSTQYHWFNELQRHNVSQYYPENGLAAPLYQPVSPPLGIEVQQELTTFQTDIRQGVSSIQAESFQLGGDLSFWEDVERSIRSYTSTSYREGAPPTSHHPSREGDLPTGVYREIFPASFNVAFAPETPQSYDTYTPR